MSKHRPDQRPSLFWPFVLIGIGVILLLSNLGILPDNSFNILWRFWPLLLVIVGLDILLGRRSAIGSIITSLIVVLLIGGVLAFIFLANTQQLPDFITNLDQTEYQHTNISAPLGQVNSASVFIDWGSGPARLYALSDSNNLLEGSINYRGNLQFDVDPDSNGTHTDIIVDSQINGLLFPSGDSVADTAWEIGLQPDVLFDLNLDASSGQGEYDLQSLSIREFELDAGSGQITIDFPSSGAIEGFIDGGSGAIVLNIPAEMQAQITLDEASGQFTPSERFVRASSSSDNGDDNSVIWQTRGFSNADNSIILEIDQGSGAINIGSP